VQYTDSACQQFVVDLHRVVAASRRAENLPDVAEGLAQAITKAGLPIDRLQLPLSVLFGLKHPIYFGIILTWVRGEGSKAWLRPLEEGQEKRARSLLAKSPFGPLMDGEVQQVRHRIRTPGWSDLPQLQALEEDGFVDYIATATELPDGARQVISIATRAPGGFADDVPERLKALCPPLALALFAIYQTQVASQIATTYLGQRTGSLVLDGQMGRGRSASLRAGIAFIDIRDFTSLSHTIGVQGMLPLLNAVFEAIDDAIRPQGGEILKLIGDAALVVFPLLKRDDPRLMSILRALLDAAADAAAATAALGRPLRVGVGFHIGDVLYGNVGSRDRHDFTVMGPAVNLASRLESLTKDLEADVVISNDVARACRATCGTPEEAAVVLDADVTLAAPVTIRGVPKPVSLWTISRQMTTPDGLD